jgi:hypothetical protein
VHLEDAVLVLHEDEGEGVEQLRRAQPDEAGRAHVQVGAEVGRVLRAEPAVHPVRGDHQVHAVQVAVVATSVLEAEVGAEGGGAVAEDLEELDARDAGEAVPARGDGGAAEVDVDVVPVREVVGDLAVRLGIGLAQVAERLVGEDDTPPERVVGAVALEDGDAARGVGLAQQERQVEPRRPPADDGHAQGLAIDCGHAPPRGLERSFGSGLVV